MRSRLVQFAGALARIVVPTLAHQSILEATAEAIASLPAPEMASLAFESKDLQLVFRHDCL